MTRRRAFSTLGCPSASVEEVVGIAETSGWNAIELRSADDSFAHPGLDASQRASVAAALGGVDRVCLSTYVALGSTEADDERVLAGLRAEAELARDLGFTAIRVFAGGGDDAMIVRRLRAAAGHAGVDIWLETHDSHSTGLAVARVLDAVDDARVGAVWDIAHPWAAGEPVSTTAALLAPWLRHVQIKDIASRRDPLPVLPGAGSLPLGEVLTQLDSRGYDGRLGLEWELRWHPDLPPLEDALAAADSWLERFPLEPRTPVRTVDDALEALTLEEKVALVSGSGFWTTAAVPRIGLRPIVLSDGPAGVRGPSMDERQPSLNLPSAGALAASWDPSVAYQVGTELAVEAARHGVDVVLGPTVNLHRTPLGGRSFESFSEDPLLTSALAVRYIAGLQDNGVGACAKHYVLNDSETERMTVSVDVDDTTLRELYLRPFEDAVAAGVWTVMSAYNSVDGVRMTEHELLRDPLRTDWGFDGVVVSDWSAVRSLDSASAGQDLAMPGSDGQPGGVWDDGLLAAVRSGEVAIDSLDEKVRHLLTLAQRVGALGADHRVGVAASDSRAAETARLLLERGSVLLANDGTLPLPVGETTMKVAVIGPGAVRPRTQGGGSAAVVPDRVSTPAEALRAVPGLEVTEHAGVVAEHPEAFPASELRAPDGTPSAVRVRLTDAAGRLLSDELRSSSRLIWLGDLPTAAREMTAEFDALFHRDGPVEIVVELPAGGSLTVDGTRVTAEPHESPLSATVEAVAGRAVRIEVVAHAPHDLELRILDVRIGRLFEDAVGAAEARAAAVAAAAAADVAVVFVGTDARIETEGRDRTDLSLPAAHDALVEAVAAANPRTVVVVSAGAPVELPWRDRVAAVLLTWFGGQEFGDGVAALLTGRAEPGGRLPTTWPDRLADAPVQNVVPTDGTLWYEEGIAIGHRAWALGTNRPAFAFGHGLGYTSWRLGDIAVETEDSDGDDGGDDTVIVVNVGNTGHRRGRQVVQVYLSRPDSTVSRPPLWLGGFASIELDAGARAEVRIRLPRRQFAHWSEEEHAWQIEPGEFTARVGFSATDLPQSIALSTT
ncbi:glycoside hydrolase family 3 C-terminal domain-containing protein [Herbiconiux sp. A18JL235]|uniref:Glycoside hydrolase family 3 C-terminal domain-containing protein n=1 Tax=Herbiconiux sp. A18JL235 TaxID=3152363 RepID=A0AB39BEY7_9MICO